MTSKVRHGRNEQGQIIHVVNELRLTNGSYVLMHRLWCPGCAELHSPRSLISSGPHATDIGKEGNGPLWGWNGSLEKPTFDPSYLTWRGEDRGEGIGGSRCHSYIRDGEWEFLNDSTHDLRGQKAKLVPLPHLLTR